MEYIIQTADSVIKNAVPIEVHEDKYKGTKRENFYLKCDYVLLSAFKDGEYIVHVEFHIKEMNETSNRENKLYVSITLGKIKIEDKVLVTVSENQSDNQTSGTRLSSEISIADLIKKINPEYGNFYKYLPSEMLSRKQNQSKITAVEDEDYRLKTMRGEDVSDVLKNKAKKQSININKIATVFGRDNFSSYIQKEIKNDNLVRIKNKSIQASERTTPIVAGYSENTSNKNIPQKLQSVNSSISENAENDIETLEKAREISYNNQRETNKSNQTQPTNNDVKYSQDWGHSIDVGEDINEFHKALTKNEWKKIIVTEMNQSGNYSVRDVLKFNAKDFNISDFKELIKEINKYGYNFCEINLWLRSLNDATQGTLFEKSYRQRSWVGFDKQKSEAGNRYDDRKNERVTDGSRVLGVHSDDISARNLESSEIENKFSLQEIDRQYAEAVKSGDEDTARKLIILWQMPKHYMLYLLISEYLQIQKKELHSSLMKQSPMQRLKTVLW